jgi:hypothetical protein
LAFAFADPNAPNAWFSCEADKGIGV